jgi:hypothetical protein
MMDAATPAEAAVRAQAEAYGEAVYHARAEIFEDMCHDRFHMTLIGPDGATFWDKAAYLERVRGRSAFPGGPVLRDPVDRRGGRRDRARASLGGRAAGALRGSPGLREGGWAVEAADQGIPDHGSGSGGLSDDGWRYPAEPLRRRVDRRADPGTEDPQLQHQLRPTAPGGAWCAAAGAGARRRDRGALRPAYRPFAPRHREADGEPHLPAEPALFRPARLRRRR